MKEAAISVGKTTPTWLLTAFALLDTYGSRALLALSLVYTGLQIYLAIRRIRKGGSNDDE